MPTRSGRCRHLTTTAAACRSAGEFEHSGCDAHQISRRPPHHRPRAHVPSAARKFLTKSLVGNACVRQVSRRNRQPTFASRSTVDPGVHHLLRPSVQHRSSLGETKISSLPVSRSSATVR